MGRASGFSFTLHCMRLARFLLATGGDAEDDDDAGGKNTSFTSNSDQYSHFSSCMYPSGASCPEPAKHPLIYLPGLAGNCPRHVFSPEESKSGPLYGTSLLQVLARTVRGQEGPTTVPESRVQVRDSTALVATQQGLRSRLWPAFFCERADRSRNLEVPFTVLQWRASVGITLEAMDNCCDRWRRLAHASLGLLLSDLGQSGIGRTSLKEECVETLNSKQ